MNIVPKLNTLAVWSWIPSSHLDEQCRRRELNTSDGEVVHWQKSAMWWIRPCGQNPGQGERKGLCPQSRTFRCQYNSIICSSAIIGCSVRLLTLPPLFHLWKTLHRWKKECHRNDTLSDHDWYVYLWFWNILTNPFCKRKCRKPCDLLHFGVANIFIYWSFMGRLQKLRNFRFPHLHGQH